MLIANTINLYLILTKMQISITKNFRECCDYLPDSRETFEKILWELWIFYGNTYKLYEDHWHTMDKGETWEYTDYEFYYDDNEIRFIEGEREEYATSPETNEYVADSWIITFISKYLENDTVLNNKRIGYYNWNFYTYEVDIELHKEYNELKEFLYKFNEAKITFNPHTLTFEKYIWYGWDHTEDFNKNLNEFIERFKKSKYKERLKGMIWKLSLYNHNLDFVDMKKGVYKFDIDTFSVIREGKIWSKIEYSYRGKILFREKETIDRPPFTAEDILNEYITHNNKKLHFYYWDIQEKDVEWLKEAVIKYWYVVHKDIAHLLSEDTTKANNKNIWDKCIQEFLELSNKKNDNFWTYVQNWLRECLTNPNIEEKKFKEIMATLNDYEKSQVYLNHKDEERKHYVYNLISDGYKQYKNL